MLILVNTKNIYRNQAFRYELKESITIALLILSQR